MFKLFAAPQGKPAPRNAPDSTRQPASSVGGTASRKQLLAVVLKETLVRNKVPANWVGIEFFRTMDRSGSRTDGIHVRLLVREEQPDLAGRMLVLERDFRRRLTIIDHQAIEWLQGISWQFDVPEEDPLAEADAAAAESQDAPARVVRARKPSEAREFTYAHTAPGTL